MLNLMMLWLLLLAALMVLVVGKSGSGGALTLAYFLGESLIHVPGCLAYLGSAYIGSQMGNVGFENTIRGFELTLIGMMAFIAGAFVVPLAYGRPPRKDTSAYARMFDRLGWRLILGGFFAYFVLLPVAGFVPSLVAIVSSLATMLILGIWLRLYASHIAHDRWAMIQTMSLLPLLPLGTLVTAGFIGYGVNWILSVLSFHYVIARRRMWFYLAAPLAVFLGLSFFVSYMGQRTGIRDVVWVQNAGLFDRLERVGAIATDFQLLDVDDSKHASALLGRLNQNYLVGAGIIRHEAGGSSFVYGDTIPWWALIPRAIWPSKPDVGGGGDLVSKFTGIAFARGTSVGVGQVLEFYMNFGNVGVILGFFALGVVLMWLDRNIMIALGTGDTGKLALSALPGLALLEPGGNLLEILVATAAAYLGGRVLKFFGFFNIGRPQRTRTRIALPHRELPE
jgi:hypothetical protein